MQYLYCLFIVLESSIVSLSETHITVWLGNMVVHLGTLPAAAVLHNNKECTCGEDHKQSTSAIQQKERPSRVCRHRAKSKQEEAPVKEAFVNKSSRCNISTTPVMLQSQCEDDACQRWIIDMISVNECSYYPPLAKIRSLSKNKWRSWVAASDPFL